MLIRTHLAVAVALSLYFLRHIDNELLFLAVIFAANLLPNLSLLFATNKYKLLRPFHDSVFLGKIMRTYTICLIATALLVYFIPVIALPFFLGYSFNLLLESFSTTGIRPFWPLKTKFVGKVSHGGTIDTTIFIVFLVIDLILLISLIG